MKILILLIALISTQAFAQATIYFQITGSDVSLLTDNNGYTTSSIITTPFSESQDDNTIYVKF